MEWFRWSPDSRVIAVTAGDETAPALSMVDVATGMVTPAERGSAVSQPTWRPPDGGPLQVPGQRGTSDAWGFRLLDRGGALVSNLDLDAGFQDDPHYRENVWAYFLDPAWSPDGSTLAFTTLEPTTRDDDPGWRVHVVTVGRDGSTSGERILPADAALDDQYEARWLPDGSGLVTHVVDEGVHGLVLHRLDGSTPRDLGLEAPTLPGGDFSFVVSPDGTQVIAWSTDPVHAWRISLVDGSRRDIDLPAQEWPTWQRLAT
jgi:Tol biopolymer transport system component